MFCFTPQSLCDSSPTEEQFFVVAFKFLPCRGGAIGGGVLFKLYYISFSSKLLHSANGVAALPVTLPPSRRVKREIISIR